MMKSLSNFEDVIIETNKTGLYNKLILQINKDLALANINLEFEEDILPTSLKYMLQETIFNLIQKKFMEYINLLYIVDVSETKVKQLEASDMVKLSEEITFLILKREWRKVWFRNKFSN